jgi:predicted porin
MKKSGIAAAVAVLGLLGQSDPAFAQSSVTLSGVADAAARQVRNDGGGTVKSLVSGSNSTSRLVIRGSEDLGGGLAVSFWLEHGILLDTGTPASSAQFWDRRSTVSVTQRGWGELRAGRDFVPSYVNWSRYDPFSYVGVAGSNNLVSATPNGPIRSAFSTSPNTTVRSSNALQWLMPGGWGGVEGGVMVAAGEGGTAANGQHKVVGLRLGWASKQYGVSVASTRTENNLTATAGGRFSDDAIGASADLGFARVSLAYRVFEQAAARQRNTIVGLWLPLGKGELRASVVQADLSGRVGATAIGANDARQIGVGYVYNLSRRSALYGTLSRLDNEGSATFAVPGGGTLRAGGSSSGLEFGVRHSF